MNMFADLLMDLCHDRESSIREPPLCQDQIASESLLDLETRAPGGIVYISWKLLKSPNIRQLPVQQQPDLVGTHLVTRCCSVY